MSAVSPFNSSTLDPELVEEAETRLQDLRIKLLYLAAEGRVASSALSDAAALERIATTEKGAKIDLQFLVVVMAQLVRLAECYDNTGLHRARPETLRDRAAYLSDLANKQEAKIAPIPIIERRKA